MTVQFFSFYENTRCEVDTDHHVELVDAQRVALDSIRRWLENCDFDDDVDDGPAASVGVLIETTRYTTSAESEGPLTHTVDPLPQIREAFPEIARRLDALDEVERRLELRLSPLVWGSAHKDDEQLLGIIREAKR